MPLILNSSDVRALVTIPDLVPLMERTLAQFSQGKAEQPLRNVFSIGPDKAYCGVVDFKGGIIGLDFIIKG